MAATKKTKKPAKKAAPKKTAKKPVKKSVTKKVTKKKVAKKAPAKKTKKVVAPVERKPDVVVAPVVDSTGVVTMNPVVSDLS